MIKLLDLYCGAGGACRGYQQAGFEVTGIDNQAQPRYPGQFIKGDAIHFLVKNWKSFDVIHASPPCQAYTKLNHKNKPSSSHDLERIIPILKSTGKPFVVENVEMAPMPKSIKLNGLMFGLNVFRQRIFYSNIFLMEPGQVPVKRSRVKHKRIFTVAGNGAKGDTLSNWSNAMGIDWMTKKELAQAIPPAYTKWIGEQLMNLWGSPYAPVYKGFVSCL